eukprot:403370824
MQQTQNIQGSQNFTLSFEDQVEQIPKSRNYGVSRAIKLMVIGTIATIGFIATTSTAFTSESSVSLFNASPSAYQIMEVSDANLLESEHPELGQASTILDTAIDTVLGKVESAAINAILGIFFPASPLDYDLIWKNIKDRVESLCKDLISDEYAYQLELRLQGLKNDLQLYDQTSYGSPQKGQFMSSLLSYIAESEPYFFDNRNPEKTMPYFTQMGTITMAVHREQVVNYRKIYGQDDIDEKQHIADLKSKIDTYLKAGQTMFDTAVKWREGFIRFEVQDKSFIIKDHWFYFVDERTDTHMFLGSDSGDYRKSEQECRVSFQTEKDKIMNAFKTELNMIIMPSQKWTYFDSTKYPIPYAPEKKIQFVVSGPYGGGIYGNSFDDHDFFINNGAPSKIHVRSGSRIDAVQFTYAGVDGPLHGGISGGPNYVVLGGDQKIVKVGVHAGDAVDGLSFWTDAGGSFNYGGRGGRYTEISAPVQGAYLAYISGKQGSHSLEQITFVWVFYA